ncbi:MAG: GyrI-like domain-containing protein [Brevibacillus sp.]|nr:GyrI-like domain-containing protein [Brevibacillus sp.]
MKDAFTVVGLTCSTTLNESKIPALWEEFTSRVGEIKNRISPNIMLGISEFSANPEHEAFTYMACVLVNNVDEIPEGMLCKTIPKREYVVVTHKGKVETLGGTIDFIYDTWLPKSEYALMESEDFEVYEDERFMGADNEESEVDIFIPIQKKR